MNTTGLTTAQKQREVENVGRLDAKRLSDESVERPGEKPLLRENVERPAKRLRQLASDEPLLGNLA